MKRIILFLLLVQFNTLLAQGCFSDCDQRLKKSTLPFGESNIAVVNELLECKAPDFNVKSTKGVELNSRQLKGKIVVLNFWYTACAPCVAELPALNRLVEEYGDKDVVFIAFSRGETEVSMTKFLKTNRFDYHLIPDNYDMTETFCVLAGWPMNIVLDKTGNVKEIFTGGYVDKRAETHAYEKIKKAVDDLLATK
jgi:peroxiredoxin